MRRIDISAPTIVLPPDLMQSNFSAGRDHAMIGLQHLIFDTKIGRLCDLRQGHSPTDEEREHSKQGKWSDKEIRDPIGKILYVL